MSPWITLAICESCKKPMNKSSFGDFWECPNIDCDEYGEMVSEDELDGEENE